MRRAKNSIYNKATLRISDYNAALTHALNKQILFSGGGAADVNVEAGAFGEALRGNGGIAECSTFSGTHFLTQFSGGGAAGFSVARVLVAKHCAAMVGIAGRLMSGGTLFYNSVFGWQCRWFQRRAGACGKAFRGNGGNCWTLDVRRHAFST